MRRELAATRAQAPPAGVNFAFGPDVPASALAAALCRTAAFLQNLEPHGSHLHRYRDWWEHDGLHFYDRLATFHDLFADVAAPRSLLASMPGDDDVFVGYAPEDGRWYLRFCLEWDDTGQNLIGRFDVTVPYDLADAFRRDVAQVAGLPWVERLVAELPLISERVPTGMDGGIEE